MTEEKKMRLRDCPVVREQVLRTWFPMVKGCTLNEFEQAWVNAGELTLPEHYEKLKPVLLHCKPAPQFLSFLDGWEACLLNQKNEDQKK